MPLHDVHAHLTHPRFGGDVGPVLRRAEVAGLDRVISNGLNLADDVAVAALAAAEPIVRPAFGLYPVDAVLPEMHAEGVEYPRDPGEHGAEETVAWVREHAGEAVAIGEIGLDGHWVPEAFWARQEEVFRALLRVAVAAGRPVILHSRKREQRCLEILQEEGVRRADFHCFGGRVKLAARIAAAGFYLSIPANARRNEAFAAMLQRLPRDRILLETDCPYLSPDRDALPVNEPASVAGTADLAAELWREPVSLVQERLADNYRALFGDL